MKTFAVREFSGGMNNYAAGFLLPENTARLIRNCEISTGSLKSINGLEFTGQTNPEDLDHYNYENRSAVKWYDKWYWSINDAIAAPYYGGSDAVPGIAYPESPPVVSAVGVSGLTGTFKYCWTYVNTDGFESAPGSGNAWYGSVTLTTQAGSYTLPAAWPDDVETIKVYRTTESGNTFYYINEHDSADVGSTFNDSDSDLDIVFRETMNTLYHFAPPDEGKYLTEYNGVFWLAVDDKIYFSEAGNPHAWQPLNWIKVDDTVTGITSGFGGILVFTANNTYQVTGTDYETVAIQKVPGQQGCPNYKTIAKLSNAPAWMSNDGLCIWDGSSIKLVSYSQYDIDFDPTHAVAGNDVYYLFHASGAMCFDRRSGDTFREIDITCAYAWYDADADAIYLLKDDSGSDMIYQLGTGSALAATYLSPQIGGTQISLKQFRRLFVNSDCEASVVFRVDGAAEATLTLYGRGRRWSYLPSSVYGRYAEIEFDFTGTLKEYAIEYSERMN